MSRSPSWVSLSRRVTPPPPFTPNTTVGVGFAAARADVGPIIPTSAKQAIERMADLSDLVEVGPASRISFVRWRKQAHGRRSQALRGYAAPAAPPPVRRRAANFIVPTQSMGNKENLPLYRK